VEGGVGRTRFKAFGIVIKNMSFSCLNTIGSVNARSKKTTTTSYTVTYSSSSLPFHYNYQNIFILSWVTSVLNFISTSNLTIDISKLITSDTDFTIEMFIQVYTSTTATSPLMVLKSTTGSSYTLGLSANSAALTFTDGSTTTTAGTSFSTKTWYHVAIVYSSSSSQYKIYANGTLHITFSKNASISYPQSLIIDVGNTTYFSNLRISTKALYTASFSSTLSFTDSTKFPYGSNLTWSSANNTVYLNTFDNKTFDTIRANKNVTITSTTTTGTLDNTEVSSTVTYSSSSLVVMGATRTTSTDGTYTLFTFTETGGYLVPAKQLACNIFGVGGGGGGSGLGGGGGSGGGIIETSSTIDTGTYLVVIGGGGLGGNYSGTEYKGRDGGATVLRCIDGTYSGNSYTYGYGGGGGSLGSYGSGGHPGSNGGSAKSDSGIGSGGNGYTEKAGGGGGGSVIAGQTTNNGMSATDTAGGNGGSGTLWTTYDSTSTVYYGGGGGGGAYVYNASSGVTAGSGGGAGGAGSNSTNGTAGTNGLGGGGGGSRNGTYGGNGGYGRLVMIFLTSDI
jgi:hypothetical protein